MTRDQAAASKCEAAAELTPWMIPGQDVTFWQVAFALFARLSPDNPAISLAGSAWIAGSISLKNRMQILSRQGIVGV